MLHGRQLFNERLVHENDLYRLSIEREREFAEWMADNMPNHYVAFSTVEQNTQQDIDVNVSHAITISFKYCPKCRSTGNIGFEIECLSKRWAKWVDGWWRSGRAMYYVFEVANVYYLINSTDIHNWVRDNGFESIKTLGEWRARQNLEMGHDHIDSKTGLLSLQRLKDLNLARPIGRRGEYMSEAFLEKVFHAAQYHGSNIDVSE